MMLSAYETAPEKCIICGARLPLPDDDRIILGSENGVYASNDTHFTLRRITGECRIFVECKRCDAVYVWSWDETGENGGVWKLRSALPLFDLAYNKQRLPLRRMNV